MKKVFLDTETTGLNPGQICQLSYIVEDCESILPKNFFFTVDNIEESAFNCHGFSVKRLKELSGGAVFNDHAQEVFKDLDNSTIICHNVYFDMKFMQAEFKNLGIYLYRKTFCTMNHFIDIIKMPSPYRDYEYKRPRLSELLSFLGVSTKDVLKEAKHCFNSKDITFHDARFDTTGLYLAYKKGIKLGYIDENK